jgi:hypothetical protein
MSDTKTQPQEEKRKLDKMLDKALEESFPGSDPVSISQPAPDEKPGKVEVASLIPRRLIRRTRHARPQH